jgi:hypothetical protein
MMILLELGSYSQLKAAMINNNMDLEMAFLFNGYDDIYSRNAGFFSHA